MSKLASIWALHNNREGKRPHDQALAMAAVSGRHDGHSSFRHNNDDDDTCSQAVDQLMRMFTPRLTPASRQRSHRLLGRIVKVVGGDDGEAAALEDGTALVHVGALSPHDQRHLDANLSATQTVTCVAHDVYGVEAGNWVECEGFTSKGGRNCRCWARSGAASLSP